MKNKIEINSAEAHSFIQTKPEIIILDVRTPDEFELGHVKNAVNIDFYHDEIYSLIDELSKEIEYLVYCRTNRRSGEIVEYMLNNGFATVYQMMDGFIGWMENELPEEE